MAPVADMAANEYCIWIRRENVAVSLTKSRPADTLVEVDENGRAFGERPYEAGELLRLVMSQN